MKLELLVFFMKSHGFLVLLISPSQTFILHCLVLLVQINLPLHFFCLGERAELKAKGLK